MRWLMLLTLVRPDRYRGNCGVENTYEVIGGQSDLKASASAAAMDLGMGQGPLVEKCR